STEDGDIGTSSPHMESGIAGVVGVDADAACGTDDKLIGSGGIHIRVLAVSPDERPIMPGFGATTGSKTVGSVGDTIPASRRRGKVAYGSIEKTASRCRPY